MITQINKKGKALWMAGVFYLLLLSFSPSLLSSCDSYIDITPKGAITVDSTSQYYELIVNPMRCYNPSAFWHLTDDAWAKESNILGYENLSYHGINYTFNEKADRTILADNNLYENMYAYIMRSNLVIDNIDDTQGAADMKALAKAEARTFRAFDHFLAVNTYAKAYDPWRKHPPRRPLPRCMTSSSRIWRSRWIC